MVCFQFTTYILCKFSQPICLAGYRATNIIFEAIYSDVCQGTQDHNQLVSKSMSPGIIISYIVRIFSLITDHLGKEKSCGGQDPAIFPTVL